MATEKAAAARHAKACGVFSDTLSSAEDSESSGDPQLGLVLVASAKYAGYAAGCLDYPTDVDLRAVDAPCPVPISSSSIMAPTTDSPLSHHEQAVVLVCGASALQRGQPDRDDEVVMGPRPHGPVHLVRAAVTDGSDLEIHELSAHGRGLAVMAGEGDPSLLELTPGDEPPWPACRPGFGASPGRPRSCSTR